MITAMLTVLCSVSVSPGAGESSILSFREMARSAQLFHQALPTALLLPVDPFAVLIWTSVAVLWFVYLWVVWHLRAKRVCLPLVASAAVGFGVLALVIPPLFSTDIFSYAMFGRLAGVYGANPYVTTPARIAASDPLMPFVFWRDISTPYGPLWTLISGVIAYGHHATPIALVLRFKALALAGTWLDGWLIYRFVRRVDPDRAGWAYLAFAWNPLVLACGPVTGHNDVLILAFVLVGAWMLQTHQRFGFAWLVASALVKYSTIPMFGASLLRGARRSPGVLRPASIARAIAVGLPLVLATFLPFWRGPATLLSALNEPGRGVNNPVSRLAGWTISQVSLGRLHPVSPTVATGIAVALFAVWQVARVARDGKRFVPWTVEDQLATWGEAATVFLVVWPRIHSWYWLLPLGLSLAAGPRHRTLAIWVVITSILAYASWFG